MRRFAVLLLFAAAAAMPADQGLLKFVMPDARIVSGISVAQVKNTPFGRFMLAQFSASEDQTFDNFVKASGFDPRYNLDEIVFASPGGGAGSRRLIVARGSFNPSRIAELARTAGGVVAPFQGVDVITNESAASQSPHGIPMSVAFLDNSTAVLGDSESVRGAIERRTAGAGPSASIVQKIRALSGASDAWFVSTIPVAELAQGLPGNNVSGMLKGDALKSIEQASGGVNFGDLVKFSGELVARTAKDASGLAEVLRFLAGLAQIGGQNPGAQASLDQLNLKAEGNLVRIALAIPEPQLESLLQQVGK